MKTSSSVAARSPLSPASSSAGDIAELRDRLLRFCTFYNPLNISNIDEIIQAYAGEEEALFYDLTVQYGPEPGPPVTPPATPSVLPMVPVSQSSQGPEFFTPPDAPFATPLNTPQMVSLDPRPVRDVSKSQVQQQQTPPQGKGDDGSPRRAAPVWSWQRETKHAAAEAAATPAQKSRALAAEFYRGETTATAESIALRLFSKAQLHARRSEQLCGPRNIDHDVSDMSAQMAMREQHLRSMEAKSATQETIDPQRSPDAAPGELDAALAGLSLGWVRAARGASPIREQSPRNKAPDVSVHTISGLDRAAAGPDGLIDVICVQCGCMAKVTSSGRFVGETCGPPMLGRNGKPVVAGGSASTPRSSPPGKPNAKAAPPVVAAPAKMVAPTASEIALRASAEAAIASKVKPTHAPAGRSPLTPTPTGPTPPPPTAGSSAFPPPKLSSSVLSSFGSSPSSSHLGRPAPAPPSDSPIELPTTPIDPRPNVKSGSPRAGTATAPGNNSTGGAVRAPESPIDLWTASTAGTPRRGSLQEPLLRPAASFNRGAASSPVAKPAAASPRTPRATPPSPAPATPMMKRPMVKR